MGAPPNAPKMKVLAERPVVALSVDSNEWPYQVLAVRGTARVELVDDLFPEYVAMARRYLGEAGRSSFWRSTGRRSRAGRASPSARRQVRILDFQARFPSAWSSGGSEFRAAPAG